MPISSSPKNQPAPANCSIRTRFGSRKHEVSNFGTLFQYRECATKLLRFARQVAPSRIILSHSCANSVVNHRADLFVGVTTSNRILADGAYASRKQHALRAN